jgi:hypothetical protein
VLLRCQIELIMGLLHVGLIALVDEVFFVGHVVIQAGFGQPQSTRNISQGGGSGAFGVEELGCAG